MRKQALHPVTAVLNNKQKNLAKQARHTALHWLEQTFPQVFDTTHKIRPLKIGIIQDILAHAAQAQAAGISRSKLREAVVIFTRRIDYLSCLKAREFRVDLTGAMVTQVTDEEAAHAALKIKKRVEKTAKNARRHLITETPAYPVERPTPVANQVVVKHKTQRTYDPNTVARLKEKLGLSKNTKASVE